MGEGYSFGVNCECWWGVWVYSAVDCYRSWGIGRTSGTFMGRSLPFLGDWTDFGHIHGTIVTVLRELDELRARSVDDRYLSRGKG